MKEKDITYDQVCELVNAEFVNNGEDLRKTVEATGLPLSVVMEATGIKDMLDFMEEEIDDEDGSDWDTVAHDDVPDAVASERTDKQPSG